MDDKENVVQPTDEINGIKTKSLEVGDATELQ